MNLDIKALKGHLVRVTWFDPADDWPYFVVLKTKKSKRLIKLKGADFPDGSVKHQGDTFWTPLHEIRSIEVAD